MNWCDFPIKVGFNIINNWQVLNKLFGKQSSGWDEDSLQTPHLAARRQRPLQLLVPTTPKLTGTFQGSGSCKYFECCIHKEHNWANQVHHWDGSYSEKMKVLQEAMLSASLLMKNPGLEYSQIFTGSLPSFKLQSNTHILKIREKTKYLQALLTFALTHHCLPFSLTSHLSFPP